MSKLSVADAQLALHYSSGEQQRTATAASKLSQSAVLQTARVESCAAPSRLKQAVPTPASVLRADDSTGANTADATESTDGQCCLHNSPPARFLRLYSMRHFCRGSFVTYCNLIRMPAKLHV